MRDTQRQRLYDAERQLPEWNAATLDWAKTQEFVRMVTQSVWWQNRGGPRNVIVKDGRGTRHARGYNGEGGGYVNLPQWSRAPIIILHEMAHVLTKNSVAPHGPEYAANFAAIVQQFMGKEVAARLRTEFKKHRVRCRGVVKPKVQKVTCHHCKKMVTARSAWVLRTEGAWSTNFCTKKHLEEWVKAQTHRGV